MKALAPDPMNCTPMQIRKKPMSLLKTAIPEGPMREAQYSLERRVTQAMMLVTKMASVVRKNVSAMEVNSGASAILVEYPITTAMVPGPAIPGIASGKNE